jgi:uncharacterized protein (DUF2147 family)
MDETTLMKRSNRLLLPIAAMLLGTLPTLAFAAAEDAFGNWRDAETGATFTVYSCGGGLCIKVASSAKDGEKDVNNSNPELRARPLAGIVLMSGASKNGDQRWTGKLYNAEDGNTYTGNLSVAGKNEIKLEGCILGGIICKSRIWRRM